LRAFLRRREQQGGRKGKKGRREEAKWRKSWFIHNSMRVQRKNTGKTAKKEKNADFTYFMTRPAQIRERHRNENAEKRIDRGWKTGDRGTEKGLQSF